MLPQNPVGIKTHTREYTNTHIQKQKKTWRARWVYHLSRLPCVHPSIHPFNPETQLAQSYNKPTPATHRNAYTYTHSSPPPPSLPSLPLSPPTKLTGIITLTPTLMLMLINNRTPSCPPPFTPSRRARPPVSPACPACRPATAPAPPRAAAWPSRPPCRRPRRTGRSCWSSGPSRRSRR